MDYVYDFLLLTGGDARDARRARALAAALAAACQDRPVRILEDLDGVPITREHLAQVVQCRYILLLCTPAALETAAVKQRVACFVKLGRPQNILPVLLDGDAIPEACGREAGGAGIATDARAADDTAFSTLLPAVAARIMARVGGPKAAEPVPATEPTEPAKPLRKKRGKAFLLCCGIFCVALFAALYVLLTLRGAIRAAEEAKVRVRLAAAQIYRTDASLASLAGDATEASRLLQAGIDCLAAAESMPGASALLFDLHRALGDSALQQDDHAATREAYAAMCAHAQAVYAAEGGQEALSMLAWAQLYYADYLNKSAQYQLSGAQYQAAIDSSLGLTGEDAEAALSNLYMRYGSDRQDAGDYAAADSLYTQALVYRTALTDGGGNEAAARLADAYYALAENALYMADYEAARRHFDQCLIQGAPAAEALGSETLAALQARRAYHALLFGGDLQNAMEDAALAREAAPKNAFVIRVYALTMMYADRYQESLTVFDACFKAGDGAQVADAFSFLRDLGREHPLMREVEARHTA